MAPLCTSAFLSACGATGALGAGPLMYHIMRQLLFRGILVYLYYDNVKDHIISFTLLGAVNLCQIYGVRSGRR